MRWEERTGVVLTTKEKEKKRQILLLSSNISHVGGCTEDRHNLFSEVPSGRTEGNGHKLEQGTSYEMVSFNERVIDFEIGTREVVDSLSVEIFKISLDKILCSKALDQTDLSLC